MNFVHEGKRGFTSARRAGRRRAQGINDIDLQCPRILCGRRAQEETFKEKLVAATTRTEASCKEPDSQQVSGKVEEPQEEKRDM